MPPKGFIGERCEVKCPCGISFFVVKSVVGKKKFCSKECRSKYFVHPVMGKVTEDSYTSVHKWALRNIGRKDYCEFCGVTEVRLEMANKSGLYKIDKNDWMTLCVKCHRNYDMVDGRKGSSIEKFGMITREPRKDSRLTRFQVRFIFTSELSSKEICDLLRIDSGTVSNIRNRKRFHKYTKDIPDINRKPSYIKLDKEDISDIRESKLSGNELAKKYSVSQSTISMVRLKKRWNIPY